jgi:hypothetical protein
MFQSNYWQALIINLPIYASSIDTMVLFLAINHPFIDHLVLSNHMISPRLDADNNTFSLNFSLFRNDTIMIKNVVDVIANPNPGLGFVTTLNATTQPLSRFIVAYAPHKTSSLFVTRQFLLANGSLSNTY